MELLNWILKSSSDPRKLSLSVKGLVVFVPSLVIALQFVELSITPENLTELITLLAVFGSGLVTLVGVGRKIINTAKKVEKI